MPGGMFPDFRPAGIKLPWACLPSNVTSVCVSLHFLIQANPCHNQPSTLPLVRPAILSWVEFIPYSYFRMCLEKSKCNCLTSYLYNAAILATFFFIRVFNLIKPRRLFVHRNCSKSYAFLEWKQNMTTLTTHSFHIGRN